MKASKTDTPPIDLNCSIHHKVGRAEISEVKALENLMLWVKFESGEIKTYDVKQLFNRIDAFKPLESDSELFKKVYVDSGGYGIVWNEDIDLHCDELWYNGEEI